MVIAGYHKSMVYGNYQLSLHNPWWEEGYNMDADSKLVELSGLKYRYLHPLINEYPVEKDVVFTLRGPRRVGKTTLIKLLIKKLIDQKIHRKSLFYLPCDRIEHFNELYTAVKDYIDKQRVTSKGRIYIFLDEVSYVKEWQRAVKSLWDDVIIKNCTLLITGSNAVDLKVSSERLPGRTGKYFNSEKLFLPLDFFEFYKLLNPAWLGKFESKDLPKFKKYLEDFMLIGGFPQVINEYYSNGFIASETYETYTKWVDGDVHKNGKSTESAYRLFKELDKTLTSRVSYTNLAKDTLFASQQSAQDYLELFDLMYVCFKCDCFLLESRKVDPKKNKKFYFVDPFIHNALLAKQDGFLDDAFNYSRKLLAGENVASARFEEIVGSLLQRRFTRLDYGVLAGDALEVDFVGFDHGKYQLFECKYGKTGLHNYLKFQKLFASFGGLNILVPSVANAGEHSFFALSSNGFYGVTGVPGLVSGS